MYNKLSVKKLPSKAQKNNPISFDGLAVRIDDLAVMTGKGFKEVHERMDRFEGRMENLERKMDALRGEIQLMYYDQKSLERRIEKLEVKNFGSVQS